MVKKIIIALVILPVIGVIGYYAANVERMDFESICKKGHKRYTKLCKNVGKNAYSKQSLVNINNINYGIILGVAWRKKGSIISSSFQKKKRRSESNSYYYIIAPKNEKNEGQFLRLASEVDPR